ncbi:hypothetical protein CPB85DRAFT_1460912 [Mucidula mucida]|nr:hypothetical protein CPB85DRAFT_1460912 [Mucidula mucida]
MLPRHRFGVTSKLESISATVLIIVVGRYFKITQAHSDGTSKLGTPWHNEYMFTVEVEGGKIRRITEFIDIHWHKRTCTFQCVLVYLIRGVNGEHACRDVQREVDVGERVEHLDEGELRDTRAMVKRNPPKHNDIDKDGVTHMPAQTATAALYLD